MRTFSPVSSFLRKVAVTAALGVLAISPAWAGKYAAIVIDMDSHKVLHSREADEERHPASLTKVMTLYLVFDALDSGKLKLNERMTVSKFASKQQPSKLGLKKGATIKVEDAIRALVTKSANDVAVVFAERLGGSEAKFAVKMNAKAKELGLEGTNFRNASGLPDKRQVTTARDMAKLAEAMFMDHKARYNYFSLPSFTWNKRKYANHNELLRKVDGVDGIKTGYTNASGYNLMASAIRDGHRVIAVMLGGTSGRSRDQHVADLLEAAFMEINGAPASQMADIRERINFGERGNSSADDLALAQLRRLTPDGEKAPAETALLASLTTSEGADVEDEGSTEEGDDDGVAVAEGEDPGDIQAEGDDDADEPAAAPAPANALPAASIAAVAKTVPSSSSIAALVSAAPEAALAAAFGQAPAADQTAQPVAAATPPAPVVATPVDPAAVAPAPASAPSPLQQ
ncbi:MAG TPA: D-alanyl-D-alanine carboxypeptidase family protein [Hyphomonadaceae bacterium]|nr:D-alanyl-D-alanine carboxypeptidase family protein [Hyphomonadaceae bacterium]